LLLGIAHSSEDPVTSNPQGHPFGMSNHLVKPKEPTVLSHKEYHGLSSANLLLFMTVGRHSQMTYPKVTLTPRLVE